MPTMPKLFWILLISVTSFALTPTLFAGPVTYDCCVVCEDGTAPDLSQGGPYGPDDYQRCFDAAFDNCLPSHVFLELKFGPAPQICTPVATPSATPTPTPTPTATPTPIPCAGLWPVDTISTLGKGQSPSNNPKVVSFITGNIVDPDSLGNTAHRIPVCSGTRVDVSVTDTSGTPSVTANSSRISCIGSTCVVETISATEKYIARSSDGKDTDRITLLPQ